MPDESQVQPAWGTALATFTQTGTFSSPVALGRRLLGLYSDNWPTAAGSVVFRASANQGGTGWPVQSANGVAAGDGTVMKLLAFGSGTYYALNAAVSPIAILPYVVLQIGTGGTAGAAAGGTIVLVTGMY